MVSPKKTLLYKEIYADINDVSDQTWSSKYARRLNALRTHVDRRIRKMHLIAQDNERNIV